MLQNYRSALRMPTMLVVLSCAGTVMGCSALTGLTGQKDQSRLVTTVPKTDQGTPFILCSQFGPITFDARSDTDETVDEIFIHNRKWLEACEPNQEEADDVQQ